MKTNPPARRVSPGAVYFVLLADMVSLALVLPVLPGLVSQLIENDQAFFLWYGAATLAFAVSFFISAGVAGRLSDRFGRRPMMIACCVGLAAGYFACALSPDILWFVASRALCGLFSANLSLSQAYVADLSVPSERGRRFGFLGVVQGLGFLIGPLLGGHLGQQDLRIPFFTAGGLALVGGLTAVFLLRESLPADLRSGSGSEGFGLFHAFRHFVKLPGFAPLVPALAVLLLAQNIAFIVWVPYATARFEWNPAQNGTGLFLFGLFAMISQGALFPWLVKKIPLRWITAAGLASAVVAYFVFGFAEAGWIAYIVMAGNMLGYCVVVGFQTLASTSAPDDSQGATMGGFQALNNLTLVFAPIIASVLLGAMHWFERGDWRFGVPMYVCALLDAAAFVLLMWGFLKHRVGAELTAPSAPKKIPRC